MNEESFKAQAYISLDPLKGCRIAYILLEDIKLNINWLLPLPIHHYTSASKLQSKHNQSMNEYLDPDAGAYVER